jgi:hypothetical protein
MEKTEELSEVVSSLQSDPKLHEEDNFLLRTVVSSQSQDLIIQPLPGNGHHHSVSLTALFWLSGAISHRCLYSNGHIFLLHYSGLQVLQGTDRHTESKVISISSFYFFKNKENRLKIKG